MIARVRGVVLGVEEQRVTLGLEGSGIALEVMVPTYTAATLAMSDGEAVELATKLVIEAPSAGSIMTPRLMGFMNADDRAFFELFTTVKGVGPRKALRAMAVRTGQIASWIAARDTKALTGLPEIGKRGAETIVAELSGKVDGFVAADPTAAIEAKPATASPAAAANGTAGLDGAAGQAALALVRLGESSGEAERRVKAALARDEALSESGADAILAAALSV